MKKQEKAVRLSFNSNLTILNKYSPNQKEFKPLNKRMTKKIADKKESNV